MKKRFAVLLFLTLAVLALGGCAGDAVPPPDASPTPQPTATLPPTPDPEELARQAELETRRAQAVAQSQALADQYRYDEALAVLSDPALEGGEAVEAQYRHVLALKAALVPYEGELRHIFFHSLIVYPELVFTDLTTPMGGYNSGFAEKAELERILPQLYERGYVLYDLNQCYEKVDGQMQRREILLPEGKIPLILSVDDVAYAYGDGYARRLFVDETGQLMYEVMNPAGELEYMPDGDVMGVVSQFVEQHPDFSWQGHKGTIALTGFQGAFGYPDYETPENQAAIQEVAEALKADGWNFASHSYTHNAGQYGYWGYGCVPENIQYDISKWVDRVSPWIGATNLFIAPFGYRAQQPALQYILDAGFDIYCTVDDKVVNELCGDYALMSRIEIGGYSMTYYRDLLNEKFFLVDTVYDAEGRPPVI